MRKILIVCIVTLFMSLFIGGAVLWGRVPGRIEIVNENPSYSFEIKDKDRLWQAIFLSGYLKAPLTSSKQNLKSLFSRHKLKIVIASDPGESVIERGDDSGVNSIILTADYSYDTNEKARLIKIYLNPMLSDRQYPNDYYEDKIEVAFLKGLYLLANSSQKGSDAYYANLDRYIIDMMESELTIFEKVQL